MKENDMISRQAAISWVKANCNPYGAPIIDYDSGLKVMEHLEKMQAAEPRTGEWLDDCGGMACSCCGFGCDDPYYLGEANYCPNCGARMEENDG